MPNIKTLIQDIYKIVQRDGSWFTNGIATEFSRELGLKLTEQAKPRESTGRLRLSQMGPKCPCELWHSIHTPMDAQPFPPWALVKFTYGHILEALAISMAKAAGHEVTGEQDAISVDGIVGHRDCVIDGCIVDVKSASSRMFEKFKSGSIASDDPFGYLDQLDGYLVGSMDDPLVRTKDKAYLLIIDKTLGHMYLYEHTLREASIRERIRNHKNVITAPRPPSCTCGEVPDGKSGNYKLDVRASYNAFKYSCRPNLRTFLYASGPVYLTRVVRRPDVTEIDKYGRIVYNG